METLFTTRHLSVKNVMEKIQLVLQVRSEFENRNGLKLTIVLVFLTFQVFDARNKFERNFDPTLVQTYNADWHSRGYTSSL